LFKRLLGKTRFGENVMRRAIFAVVAILGLATAAAAQTTEAHDHSMAMDVSPFSEAEHLAHLREVVASRAVHGPVIPQPASVGTAATRDFTITAKSFSFTTTPSPFTVNQGDVVNITLTVPSNDPATGHGVLMDTYIENGFSTARGASAHFQFTATTVGDFPFVCSIPDCGSGHSNMFGSMKVVAVANPAPTVASILPTSGGIAGGTVVTISGTGFLTNPTVKFGGASATNVSATATSITATAPAHAAGKVDVVVTNTDGQSATLTQAFTYTLPAPAISSVSPNSGPTTGGTPVTITGTNFQNGATVTFGALPATDVIFVSATSITARTPLGPATQQLAVDVSVTNPDSTKATATGAFTYNVPALTVVSITPNTALPSGATGAAATTVTIFGAGFTTALASSVTVGGVAATNVQVIDPVTIHATVPVHAAGTGDVVVTVGGSSATLHDGFSWQNAPSKRRAAKH
jgi:heme/copper-type cytochrome/quinol oxidase subunit 2